MSESISLFPPEVSPGTNIHSDGWKQTNWTGWNSWKEEVDALRYMLKHVSYPLMRILVKRRGDGTSPKASPHSGTFYSVSVLGKSLMRRTKRVYTSTEFSDCINPCNCWVGEYQRDIAGYTVEWVAK